ncbi:MAG: C40 family peptidase [Candidatus Ancillula trichonymphae]|jgi:hypothetical protein|nr:C40 family peptidase [Candidatus Ancillula trichonymphae]
MQNVRTWALARQGITFVNPPDESLDGQCVTLIKAFLAECCEGVANPYAARGNALDFGSVLVAQGYAAQVSNLQPGDILVYDVGTPYGHIALYIDDNRLFEENAAVSPATLAMNGTWTSRVGDYRTATSVYRLGEQYYNENTNGGSDMTRRLYNKGDGAIWWYTDTHYGAYSDGAQLDIDLQSGSAVLPVYDYTDRSAPWDIRIEQTRARL